jgi:hypothetical protein
MVLIIYIIAHSMLVNTMGGVSQVVFCVSVCVNPYLVRENSVDDHFASGNYCAGNSIVHDHTEDVIIC